MENVTIEDVLISAELAYCHSYFVISMKENVFSSCNTHASMVTDTDYGNVTNHVWITFSEGRECKIFSWTVYKLI